MEGNRPDNRLKSCVCASECETNDCQSASDILYYQILQELLVKVKLVNNIVIECIAKIEEYPEHHRPYFEGKIENIATRLVVVVDNIEKLQQTVDYALALNMENEMEKLGMEIHLVFDYDCTRIIRKAEMLGYLRPVC